MDTVTAQYERMLEGQRKASVLNWAQGAWIQLLLSKRPPQPTFTSTRLDLAHSDNRRLAMMASYKTIPIPEFAYRRSLAAMVPMPAVAPSVHRLAQPIPFNVVQGEILRDMHGRLYERIGSELRPLPPSPVTSDYPDGKCSTGDPVVNDELGAATDDIGKHVDTEKTHQDETESAHSSSISCSYKKLFADPGRHCLARFGDVKHILGSQIMQPTRLRDEHQLPCYVQVYAVTKQQRLESLASALLSDSGYAGKLYPLTDLLAHKLQLHDILPHQPLSRHSHHREPGVLLTGDRVVRLQVIQDPTQEQESAEPPQSIPTQPNNSDRMGSRAVDQTPSGHTQIRKTQIPTRFLKSWEFQLSREEALYDMHQAKLNPPLSNFYRGLKEWINGDGEFKKWQALLDGKVAEEQLWAVKPPKGGLQYPVIRDWASKTLEFAGYDPQTMLTEWEIYWRRKGV